MPLALPQLPYVHNVDNKLSILSSLQLLKKQLFNPTIKVSLTGLILVEMSCFDE